MLALHPESPMWEVDRADGTWKLDGAGEKIPMPSVCLECSPADTAAAFEDCEWDDGYETVYWPCPTVRAITAHVDPT